MNTTFGAKLLTKPEQFFLKTDTDEEKTHIRRQFKILDILLRQPVIDKYSHNDTIELKRVKSKKGFAYQMSYNSPEIDNNNFKNIKIYHSNHDNLNAKEFSALLPFQQLSYAIMSKAGIFNKDLPLFSSYTDWFKKTFGISYSDFFNQLVNPDLHI